jgi:ubiquinone/menaquinone biosynthesis C-methylase UbiE
MNYSGEDHLAVRRFYETYGGERGQSGQVRDAEAFVDLRPVMSGYGKRSARRVVRLLGDDGDLLDIGCGGAPLPVRSRPGTRRMSLDVAGAALRAARDDLAARSAYVQADVCRLPFADNVFGRVLCAHVLYHLPPRRQRWALVEIHRVLAEGGVAVVVLFQPQAVLHRLTGRLREKSGPAAEHPRVPHHPVDYRDLCRDLGDRMSIEVRTWAILEADVTRVAVPDNLFGRGLVAGVAAVESLLPHQSLRWARYPMLVIRKPGAGGAGQRGAAGGAGQRGAAGGAGQRGAAGSRRGRRPVGQ